MYRSFYIILSSFIVASIQAFIFGEKEPLVFCIKVCPLYCSPRRRDDDASSLIYIDDHRDLPYHYDYEQPHHFDPYYYCKPPKWTTTTTTTTSKPTTTTMKTTTAEPTWICMVCAKKCTQHPKS